MYVHGNNLEQKENHRTKYRDAKSKLYLKEIRTRYDKWKENNEKLSGPTKITSTKDKNILKKRVALLNEYKNFLDQQHYAEKFDSRSNLHSSVLEEFMYYLFRDLVESISNNALIGKSHSFKDIFFRASNYEEMVKKPHALIEVKDHDFSIGASITATMQCRGSNELEIHAWDLPAIAIECKTYLDKTMLQDVSTAAAQLKQKNPNALYLVVSEWLKLTESVNLKKYKIDQIYILRKQKNTDREFVMLLNTIKIQFIQRLLYIYMIL
ncbi:MAG: Bpu10I family restriction endonuclease [Proteobacteria bacterium]|nr:Bpu10I family restriction endonuclease [Pseudomonadota bacterium]